MYNLFLETRAAAQIKEWCIRQGCEGRTEEILKMAYLNACNSRLFLKQAGGFDGYLFSRCTKADGHYYLDIDSSFIWDETPEGHKFWAPIQRIDVPVPQGPLV
ncbi:hypothetical protein D3C81_2073450 [compost metagenome]